MVSGNAVYADRVNPSPLGGDYWNLPVYNKPLTRSVAGKREFDINLDRWAHIGLLPDFLQDLKKVGFDGN